jgi:uncharacterized protein
MTQPAKVQEPSMEEILASIRRIIADDEAKPAAAEKPASPPAAAKPAPPAAKPAAMKDIPPSAIVPAPKPAPAAAKPTPAPAPPPPAPEPAAASNNQDDIDAMLASLEAATPESDIRPAQPEAQPEADVFDLTDEMALPDPPPAAPAAAFHKIDPQDDLEFSESAAAKALHRQPTYEPPPFESAAPPLQQILSRSTVSSVESAFNSLANTVLSNNARTLEDLVKEMLRPMLKSWLDDNLPGLVERIVKAEIERVSRGR